VKPRNALPSWPGAHVLTAAPGKIVAGLTVDVEEVGVGVVLLVTVGGAIKQHDARAGQDDLVADAIVGLRNTREPADHRGVANALIDRRGNELPALTELRPLLSRARHRGVTYRERRDVEYRREAVNSDFHFRAPSLRGRFSVLAGRDDVHVDADLERNPLSARPGALAHTERGADER
jgi:hypothetical protein